MILAPVNHLAAVLVTLFVEEDFRFCYKNWLQSVVCNCLCGSRPKNRSHNNPCVLSLIMRYEKFNPSFDVCTVGNEYL